MVEFNPEEEKKGESKPNTLITFGARRKAPLKSVAEICASMQVCILDADRNSIDFINFLCDAAMNLDPLEI